MTTTQHNKEFLKVVVLTKSSGLLLQVLSSSSINIGYSENKINKKNLTNSKLDATSLSFPFRIVPQSYDPASHFFD